MAKVLLVEDDADISLPLGRALVREGHEVEIVADGLAAESAAPGAELIILDLGLPGKDGLRVCRTIRESGIQTPIIILSARTGELDLVLGLDAGADDYVTKPFRVSELMARIRAALRRLDQPGLLQVGRLSVDVGSRSAAYEQQDLALTPKEFDLLAMLVRHAPVVVSREQILKEVWNTDWFGAAKTVDMHISTLRRKLADAGAPRDLIATVRGAGFRFTRQ